MSKIETTLSNTNSLKRVILGTLLNDSDINYVEANNTLRNYDYLFRRISGFTPIENFEYEGQEVPDFIKYSIFKANLGPIIEINVDETKNSDGFKLILNFVRENQISYLEIKKALYQIDKELLAISFTQAL